MSAIDPGAQQRPDVLSGVSMRDLLASCAAAEAVSLPPRAPDPRRHHAPREHREAA